MASSSSGAGQCPEVSHAGTVLLQRHEDESWSLLHVPLRRQFPLPSGAGQELKFSDAGYGFLVGDRKQPVPISEYMAVALHALPDGRFFTSGPKGSTWLDDLKKKQTVKYLQLGSMEFTEAPLCKAYILGWPRSGSTTWWQLTSWLDVFAPHGPRSPGKWLTDQWR
eukprot:4301320-Lingulodinium_polyedra.AAC.1